MPNNMTLCTDKDLRSKYILEKKVYILAKDIDSKRKFKIKAKKFWIEKGLFVWVTLTKHLDSFTKYFSVYKILVP